LARQASTGIGRFATRVEQGGGEGTLEDAKRYARRHPGMFLLGTFGAGFAIGRVLRNANMQAIQNGTDQASGNGSSSFSFNDTLAEPVAPIETPVVPPFTSSSPYDGSAVPPAAGSLR
jgi:hypothetical protein